VRHRAGPDCDVYHHPNGHTDARCYLRTKAHRDSVPNPDGIGDENSKQHSNAVIDGDGYSE
jgi:hypothetical protein